jgi:hypothetical protein
MSAELGAQATTADAERLCRLFRFFAATQCRGRSRVYEVLSEAIADGVGPHELLLATPEGQRRPSLLFAAVNLQLASGTAEVVGSNLADYYPIHGGRRPVDDQLLPTFSVFCAENREALLGLLRKRSTQTNEIRRCVALRLGLEQLQRTMPGPTALVEVGASAGLNLRFDRYRYRLIHSFTAEQPPSAQAQGSPVVVSCDVRGTTPGARLLGAMPEVTSRLGIDQEPIDVNDADARAWLEAFIWLEDLEGLALLRSAIDVAASTPEARVVRGDATRDVARMIAELPGSEPVTVFTATLLAYLSAGERAAFVAQLDEAAARRPVAWIFGEAPGLLAPTAGLRIAALSGPLAQRNGLFAVGTSVRGGDEDRILAVADPYLRWIAPARSAADDFQWVEGP